MSNALTSRSFLLEVGAIALLIAARASGFLPIPAWPLLLLIAAGFGQRPWHGLTLDQPSQRLSIWMIGFVTLLGIGYQFFTIFIEEPVLAGLFGEPETPPDVGWLVGNLPGVLGFLLLIILFSIGEEIAFRGYLLQRIYEWAGPSFWGVGLALVLSSFSFGISHTWQNATGMVGTMISGLFFGAVYLLSKRDIRAPILAHLAVNITALILAYFGLFIS